MRISDWSSDVCSSDLGDERDLPRDGAARVGGGATRLRDRGERDVERRTLPISLRLALGRLGQPADRGRGRGRVQERAGGGGGPRGASGGDSSAIEPCALARSEERLVGEEGVGRCGSRGWRSNENKKKQ